MAAMNWQQQAQTLLSQGNYAQAAHLYEQAIEAEPEVLSHYWQLGLTYLLQGKEEEAQTVWLWALVEGDSPDKSEQLSMDLAETLEAEAQRQAALENWQASWLIRQHIRELAPRAIHNLLHLIQLSIKLGNFDPEALSHWQAALYLRQSASKDIDSPFLLEVLEQLMHFPEPPTLAFIEAAAIHLHPPTDLVTSLLAVAAELVDRNLQPNQSLCLLELADRLEPDSPRVLRYLSGTYSKAGQHQQAIVSAERYYHHCQSTAERVIGSYLLLHALLTPGAWSEAESVAQCYEDSLQKLAEQQPQDLNSIAIRYLITSIFLLPYLGDRAERNSQLKKQIGQIVQNNLSSPAAPRSISLARKTVPRRLRVGYIGHNLRKHSVGWLCRWLFQYHDRESFDIGLYLINQYEDEITDQLKKQANWVHSFGTEIAPIIKQIQADEIDILVDLDSITYYTVCEVMAYKPAPIQITWLGWDASGIPAVDYFIADPYVLPEDAQEYYQEKIWRLPQTYIAVDGFEVGVPTLQREKLGIPTDAVIYYSSQSAFKRHPETVRLQMQILKQVPNSYFLVKGFISDPTIIEEFFTRLAKEEGVEPERLRFLPPDPTEYVHRANLAIADVVLDTYPYNGATTTLETLWMGIPLVTRVGEQFSARNSYGFLVNAGIKEGIAWSAEEYVEWGVRLGKDQSLRQQIHWKLMTSRRSQTTPLWNTQQFAREMEKAYQQMWMRYLELS